MAEAVHAIYLFLAVWMILSGIDDFWVDFAYLLGRLHDAKSRWSGKPSVYAALPEVDVSKLPEARIALWVPAWREDAVIAHMLTHNTASIRYTNYHVFAGTYPNDEATLDVLRGLEEKFPNLHVSLAPHDGPTSKADNMNWIYQNLCMVEEQLGQPFDIVVIHDSEDLIHPEEFRWLNYYCQNYDFVQIPVLALPTPWWHFTHGVYCDEFAETQQKDLPTRNRLRGFSPSCGVGTGYRRDALAKLAEAEDNRLFEPDSLTEDYINGMRMHRIGMRQIYLPVFWLNEQPVATREYFPQNFKAAVRQRSRWVTGIALQSWQKVGWSSSWSENYWFWRDRKGLLGNPLSLVANFLFVLCALGVLERPQVEILPFAGFGILLQLNRIMMRMHFSMRVYGIVYGLSVPFRIPYSNLVNTLATLSAVQRYFKARVRKETLVWLKTEHQYPNRAALTGYSRRLGEVLVDQGVLSAEEVAEALASKPEKYRLGEYLVAKGRCSWEQVYAGLSLLSGYPTEAPSVERLEYAALRTLPLALCEEHKLQPVQQEGGAVVVATCEIPKDEVLQAMRRYARRGVALLLVTPPDFAMLREAARLVPEPEYDSAGV